MIHPGHKTRRTSSKRRTLTSYDKSKRGQPGRDRVNVHEDYEVASSLVLDAEDGEESI
jgi:hypothetical protein